MNELKYEVITRKSFEDAVSSIIKNLEEVKFGVLWKLNFKEKLKEKEIDFRNNFMILEVCNPQKAKEVLTKHIDVGYFLPCKIVVYEEADSVKIGMMNTEKLIGMLGYSDLIETAKDVQDKMVKAINRSV
jgi:uncharacterized protein (DUF302 family)